MSEQNQIQKEVEIQHTEWLMHPMTRTLKHILQKMVNYQTDLICLRAVDPDVNAEYLRYLVGNLNTLKKVQTVAFETARFVENSN